MFRRIVLAVLCAPCFAGVTDVVDNIADAGGVVENIADSGNRFDDAGAATNPAETVISPEKMGEAGCAIDVEVAMSRLFSAGIDVTGAVTACQNANSASSVVPCLMDVTAAIAAFAHVGEFLAGGVASCQGIASGPAVCTSVIMGIVAEFNSIVSAASGIAATYKNGTCTNGTDGLTAAVLASRTTVSPSTAAPTAAPTVAPTTAAPTTAAPSIGRRLSSTSVVDAINVGDLKNASCANDALSGLSFLMASAATIASSTKSCTGDHGACEVGVTSNIQALAYAGTFLSLMVQDCTFQVDHTAVCAAVIMELVAAISGLAARAGQVAGACNVAPPATIEEFSVMKGVGTYGADAGTTGFMVFLVGLLPVTGLVSFATGTRFARHSRDRSVPASEVSLVALNEEDPDDLEGIN